MCMLRQRFDTLPRSHDGQGMIDRFRVAGNPFGVDAKRGDHFLKAGNESAQLPRTPFVASDYHLIARFLLTLYR
jgi:hypothetical protein